MSRVKWGKVHYKLDSKGKVRVWMMSVHELDDHTAMQRTESGLEDGKPTVRKKTIKDSKHEGAYDRAVKLMRNTIEKKQREGYTVVREEALHAPTLTHPMKAQTYVSEKHLLPDKLFVQPKINGLRCLYYPDTDKLMTKSGLVYDIPEIMDDVRTLSKAMGGAILDGELFCPELPVATIKSLTTKTEHERDVAQMNYHVFDVINLDQQFKRFELLSSGFRKLFEEKPSVHWRVKYVFPELIIERKGLEQEYEHHLAQGYEGMMIRYYDAPYEAGKRSKYLLKWKPVFDAEFEVVAITYENRMVNGVQYKLVEFHCFDPMSGKRFKAVPKWDVERRFQFYKSHGHREAHLVIGELDPLTVEFRERTVNGVPFHAVAVDFRSPGY